MSQMPSEWDTLFEEAILDHELLPHLFPDGEYSETERDQIAALLEKFGFIVRLYHAKKVSWLDVQLFLVIFSFTFKGVISQFSPRLT
eukprot:m.299678 g.299678  ORF g.299678 m.299678 type:complete len:87 (-) comp16415_c0_seq45:684-944(-)